MGQITMRTETTVRNKTEILKHRRVPNLLSSQLERITPESLLARDTGPFSVENTVKLLGNAEGRTMWGIDIGGTGVKARRAIVTDGQVKFIGEELFYPVQGEKENAGLNYVGALEQICKEIGDDKTPVGISVAGIVDNGKLIDSPNLKAFTRELEEKGGFDKVLKRHVAVYNDAAAGLISGAIGAAQNGLSFENIIYLINGGGIGGAALVNGRLISMEPGHIEVDRHLNPFGVTEPCGFLDRQHVCIERLSSMGRIEDIWEQLQGERLTGKQIAERMYGYNKLAAHLLDNSAVIMAHGIEGIRQSLNLTPDKTLVVGHGGGFKVSGMVDRIDQVFKNHRKNSDLQLTIKPTSAFGIDNACLTGAAIAAVTV